MTKPIQKLHEILQNAMTKLEEIIALYPQAKQSYIQLGVYRNYNSEFTKIFESSPFSSKALDLLSFWKKVQPEGGWGHEAIEVAYLRLN